MKWSTLFSSYSTLENLFLWQYILPCRQPKSWRTAWLAQLCLCQQSRVSWSQGRLQRSRSQSCWGQQWTWYAGSLHLPAQQICLFIIIHQKNLSIKAMKKQLLVYNMMIKLYSKLTFSYVIWISPLFLYLSIISDVVTQTDKAGLEFFRLKTAWSVLIEMVERNTELVHLVFTDTLRIPSQDLKKNRF